MDPVTFLLHGVKLPSSLAPGCRCCTLLLPVTDASTTSALCCSAHSHTKCQHSIPCMGSCSLQGHQINTIWLPVFVVPPSSQPYAPHPSLPQAPPAPSTRAAAPPPPAAPARRPAARAGPAPRPSGWPGQPPADLGPDAPDAPATPAGVCGVCSLAVCVQGLVDGLVQDWLAGYDRNWQHG
jgi:hypothetical protein